MKMFKLSLSNVMNGTKIVKNLIIVLIFFAFYNACVKNDKLNYEMTFSCDTKEIYGVNLLDKNGYRIVLRKKGAYWKINDQFMARESAVNNLLETINSQEISYWVPDEAKMNIVKDLATNGIKVEVLRKDKDPFVFYVGGVTPDENGTFMIKKDAQVPFVVNLPGFVGSLRSRYMMSLREWRSRLIVNMSDDEIDEFSMDYESFPVQSFSLREKNSNFELMTHHGDVFIADQDKVKYWLRRFSSLNAESVIDDESIIRNYQSRTPFLQISLVQKTGDQTNWKVYPNIDDVRNTIDLKGNLNFERYIIIRNNKDAFMVQKIVVKDIFIGYESLI